MVIKIEYISNFKTNPLVYILANFELQTQNFVKMVRFDNLFNMGSLS